MGNAVFPDLLGLDIKVGKSPEFSTLAKRAVSGREVRVGLRRYPLWTLSLNYNVLRGNGFDGAYDLETILGFFLARNGSYDSFLYLDPSDSVATNMAFGQGDGVTTDFRLTRALGAGGFTFVEPVENPATVSAIKVDGVTQTLTTDYTVGATGIISFVTAPGDGESLTWTGTYRYRVRFVRDVAQYDQFLRDLWELKRLELVGAPGNKV